MLEFEKIAALCEDRDLFSRVVTRSDYTPQEAALIGAAYLQVFKKQIVRTCGNCVGDALAQLVALYRKNPNQMKEQNKCRYQLRAGMLIRLKFGDNVFYSNANLTDKVAEAYILAKPSRLSDFEKYPDSIKAKIKADESAATRAKGTTTAKRGTGGRGRKTGKGKATESATTVEAAEAQTETEGNPATEPERPATEPETQE